MAVNLPPVPHKAPVIDGNGFLTQAWSDWFTKALARMGGHVASSNDELYTVTSERIAAGAVTEAGLAASVAGNGLSGGAGSPLAVSVDGTTLEINADALRVKDSGISTAKLSDSSVSTAKVIDGAISAAKLFSTDWARSVSTSGYQRLPFGLYVQWGVTGSTASGGTAAVTFPLEFPTACRQVIAGIRDNSAVATTATGQVGTGNYSTTGCSIYNRTSVAQTCNWIAIGN